MTPEHMAKIHAASFTQPRPWSVKEFTHLLGSPRTRSVTSDNGFAFVQIAGPEAELLTIAVHPNARRSGEGSTVLAKVLNVAKADNCEEIFLEVVDTNTAAIALYHRHGFKDRAARKEYYNGPNGVRSSALIMHKRL